MYDFQGTILCVRGITIDGLDIPETRADDQEQSSKIAQELPTAHTPYSVGHTLTEVCRTLVLDRHDRYLRFTMPISEFLNEFLALCALSMSDPTAVKSKFLEWFNNARHFQIHGHTLETLVLEYLKGTSSSPQNAIPNQDHYTQDSFFGRWYDTIVRMSLRLTLTHNGRVAMIPENARKTDLVCILYGCSVPVLLRKVRDDGAYTLVGECYIDQYMSGEALESEYPELTFRIR
jgi:hypothetical protein